MHVVDTAYFVSKLNNMKKTLLFLFAQFILLNTGKAQVIDTAKATTLKQITIKANKPQIIVKNDKVIVAVEGQLNTEGLNALELLRQAPSVTVDGQDNVQMSGKSGIQILIDGRLQVLSSQQIASLLKGTNASNIKSLEIIANPSAKYDAAGSAGIINIVLKKSTQKGVSGSLSAGYQQMENYRQNSALNLNLKQNRLLLYTNANFDHSLQNTKVSSTRALNNKTFEQTGREQQGYSNPGIRTGMIYELNGQHKVGVLFNFQRIWDDFPSFATTVVRDPKLPDLLSTNTTANITENRYTYNFNYQYTAKNNTTLNLDADQLTYNANLSNTVFNTFQNNNLQSAFANTTDTKINLSSIKADLAFKTGKLSIENGAKLSISSTKNLLNATQSDNQAVTMNQYNDFNYHENNYALYTNINTTLKKWSLQIGLRAELTQLKSLSVALTKQINLPDTGYLNIFPSVFLRYQFNEKQSVGLSYNRRITRPSFQDQNPYNYRTDFYYANEGNPLLLPQFTQSLALDYTFNGQSQLKLNYNQTTNLIETISTQLADQTLTKPVNAGTRSYINISLSSPTQLSKFWSIYYTVEPYYQFYRADLSTYNGLAAINNGGFGLNSYISNNFNLSKTLKGSLSSWFNYASRSSIYSTKPIYSIDATLRKQLLNGKLTATLAYRDIFNTQRWQQSILLGNINQTSLRKWESSGAYIALMYNFGSKKINKASQKDLTEEQQRIKSRN